MADADDYVGVYQAIDRTIAYDEYGLVPCSSTPTIHDNIPVYTTYFTLLANRDGQITQIYCDSASSCPTEVQQVIVHWLTPSSSGFESDTTSAEVINGEGGPNPPKHCEMAKTRTTIQWQDSVLHVDQQDRDVSSSDVSNCTVDRTEQVIGDSQDCSLVSDVRAVQIK
jgi:hypothetical protein